MAKKWSVVSIVLILALLIGNTSPVFADSTMDAGDMSLTEVNPYEYNTAPDGLFVFLYHGHAPYLNMDIDTSECTVDHLYVYIAADNSVIEICDENVMFYTATKDALYYGTSAHEIIKTDYTGRDQEVLYQYQGKDISKLSCYLDNLYFVEDNCNVVFLNTSTGTAETVFAYEDLAWVFLLSSTELLAVTLSGEHHVYDITTREITEISEVEANLRMNQAVLSYAESQSGDVALMAVYDATDVTQENDISFPLAEYPANSTGTNYTYYKPLSWFHKNGQEGCSSTNCDSYVQTGECEGFACYAHDAYWHVTTTDESIYYTGWLTSMDSLGKYNFNNDIDTIKSFYSTLNTGAYLRYGNDTTDDTPSNGMHSAVFISADDSGVWVYECNQSYYQNLTTDEINGKLAEYFGCGVFIQYLTYYNIKARYDYVLHYINHTISSGAVYENITYHTVECTGCDGYLRQEHSGTELSVFVSVSQHRKGFTCCPYTEAHTSTPTYIALSATKHRVRATCCGYIDETHTFRNNVCRFCGYDSDDSSSILSKNPEMLDE